MPVPLLMGSSAAGILSVLVAVAAVTSTAALDYKCVVDNNPDDCCGPGGKSNPSNRWGYASCTDLVTNNGNYDVNTPCSEAAEQFRACGSNGKACGYGLACVATNIWWSGCFPVCKNRWQKQSSSAITYTAEYAAGCKVDSATDTSKNVGSVTVKDGIAYPDCDIGTNVVATGTSRTPRSDPDPDSTPINPIPRPSPSSSPKPRSPKPKAKRNRNRNRNRRRNRNSTPKPSPEPSPKSSPSPSPKSSLRSSPTPTPMPRPSGKVKQATTTRYWDCCKPSCAWPGKARVTSPVQTCSASGRTLGDALAKSGCDGGSAYMCADQLPFAVSDDLAYGFAATGFKGESEDDWCCACYELTFLDGPVAGKRMIVQSTNTGHDYSTDNHFDIAMPGGGQGLFLGCDAQFGAGYPGARYGGISKRSDCSRIASNLRDGCYWRFDWYKNADNPRVEYRKVSCPSQLEKISGCRRK